MENLIIDPEFRDKIFPLSEDEFKKLEENILADGEVREPLVVWNDTIIDGHNRWKIIQKHNLTNYIIKQMEFPDKWSAIVWMCRNQLGRRNLTEIQRTVIVAQQYEAQRKTIGGQDGNKNAEKRFLPKEGIEKRSRGTSKKVAEQAGVSWGYVERAARVNRGLDAADEISPGFKDAVIRGEIKASKEEIAAIRNMDDEQKKDAVEKIKRGEPVKEKFHEDPKQPSKQEQPAKLYNGGGTKEYRELRESIEGIAADMYNSDKPVVYTVDDLIEEIRVNAEAYVKQLKRTLEIRFALLTDENRPVVLAGVEQHVMKELEKVVSLLK